MVCNSLIPFLSYAFSAAAAAAGAAGFPNGLVSDKKATNNGLAAVANATRVHLRKASQEGDLDIELGNRKAKRA
jgi:hypothetical protein